MSEATSVKPRVDRGAACRRIRWMHRRGFGIRLAAVVGAAILLGSMLVSPMLEWFVDAAMQDPVFANALELHGAVALALYFVFLLS